MEAFLKESLYPVLDFHRERLAPDYEHAPIVSVSYVSHADKVAVHDIRRWNLLHRLLPGYGVFNLSGRYGTAPSRIQFLIFGIRPPICSAFIFRLQPPDEFVEFIQVDVRKQRAEHAALRASEFRLLEGAILHIARLQEPTDEFYDPPVVNLLGDQIQQYVMVDIVEEGRYVPFYDPGCSSAPVLDAVERRVTAPAWSESVGRIREHRFVDALQKFLESFLNQLVPECRYAQWPHLAVRFRDVFPPCRLRIEPLGTELVDDLVDHLHAEAIYRPPVRAPRHVALVGGKLEIGP